MALLVYDSAKTVYVLVLDSLQMPIQTILGFTSSGRARLDWSKTNVSAIGSRQEIPVDNPPGDDETPTVVDEQERVQRRISGVPRGPRRVRLASGLRPRGIETQLNFKMICAHPALSPPRLTSASLRFDLSHRNPTAAIRRRRWKSHN